MEIAIECLLAGLLTFAPFAFGSVHAWSEAIVIAVAAVITTCFCLKLLLVRDVEIVRSWAYLPIGLFFGFAVLQLVRLPTWLVGLISPHTAGLRSDLLGNLPNAGEVLRSATLSFYPTATRHDLRLLLAVTAIFVVVVNTYRRAEQIKRLLLTVIIIGAAAALLAFAQDISGATNIYWIVPSRGGLADSGPFVTYSHYGQFMNLSVGAGIGFLLVILYETYGRGTETPFAISRWRNAKLLPVSLIASFIVLGTVTVFLSGSRGAMVSFIVSLGVGGVSLSRARGLKVFTWMAVPLALVACAAVLFLGPDAVMNRLFSLQHRENYHDRVLILKDLTAAWRLFPVAGTGLGTHEVVFPMFNHSIRPQTFTHAENEYAQIMEETGVVGLALVMVFVAIIGANCIRATRDTEPAIRLAAVGLGIGLLAILIHSLSDFGQHLPANAFLTAAFSGLLVSLARLRRRSSSAAKTNADAPAVSRAAPWRLIARAAGSIFVAMGFGWALLGALSACRAEPHWVKASGLEQVLAANGWDATNGEYADLISEASRASELAPDNVLYRYSLSAYRWHAVSRVVDPRTNATVLGSQGLATVKHILVELDETRLLCPVYSHTYSLAGQLETSILSDPRGPSDIRAAYQLGRADPWACGQAAHLDAIEGHWTESEAEFRRYLDLSGPFTLVIQTYLTDTHRPDLALELARGNPINMSLLASALGSSDPANAARVRSETVALLKASAAQPDAPADLLVSAAEQYNSERDYVSAIACYQRALAQSYENVGWHLSLANILVSAGRIPEAIRETDTCLRLSPDFAPAAHLRDQLRVNIPSTIPAL